MDNNSIDFLPYHPKLARDYLNIIQNVFGIDFFNLNEKYKRKGFISDDLIEEHFQKLTVQDWIFLKNKYSLAGVVLPNNWNRLSANSNCSLGRRDRRFNCFQRSQ